MTAEELYRQANDKIHAPENLKLNTLRKMEEEAAKRIKREPHPVYVQQVMDENASGKVIPLRQHRIRTALTALAAAAVFFLAGRYLLPAMRPLPVREDVANVITQSDSIEVAFADKSRGADNGQAVTLMMLDLPLSDLLSGFDTEEIRIGKQTAYLYEPEDGMSVELYFEKDGRTFLMRSETGDRDALTEMAERFLD